MFGVFFFLHIQAAEGLEQHEAERYLALIDPAQAVLIDSAGDESQVSIDGRSDRLPYSHHPPLDEEYRRFTDITHQDTVRAQAQARSAIRARRIKSVITYVSSTMTVLISRNIYLIFIFLDFDGFLWVSVWNGFK